MIKLVNVYKKYKDNDVLKNTNLHINKGELVFLTGVSGSGKSTIIKLLTKQENSTHGSIIVNDVDISKIKKRKEIQKFRQSIGIVFQDYQLIKEMTVHENLKFILEYLGANSKTIKSRILEICSELDIADILHKKVETLSGGEQQRVAIARAIINKPQIIVADEPTGNLDPKAKEEIINIFEHLNNKGTTIIIVTHDIEIINNTLHKVYELSDGYIVPKVIAVG